MKLTWLTALLFPKRCPFCGAVIPQKDRCCRRCENALPLPRRDLAGAAATRLASAGRTGP